VNPLVISGRFGESIDPVLSDFEPVADEALLAKLPGQLIESLLL
jgi:hypothetical protein